jgi:hypothetical protein
VDRIYRSYRVAAPPHPYARNRSSCTRRKQFAEDHADETPQNRRLLIEAEVHLAYGKQLSNLALQEARLLRQHEKQVAQLQALLNARHTAEQAKLTEIAALYEHCRQEGKAFDRNHLSALGFEFSHLELKQKVAERLCRTTNPKWPNIAAAEFVAHFELIAEQPEEVGEGC